MPINESKKVYLQWLNDAYSQELGLVSVLENHAKDLESHSMDNSRIVQHVSETKRHAELLKGCIERLGGDISNLKATVGKAIGAVTGMSTGMFSDELIKNALTDYAAEHLEIACYTSLIAAAERENDTLTVDVCRQILEEEISMAEWVGNQIPLITDHVLYHADKD